MNVARKARETFDEAKTVLQGMSDNVHMDLYARDMDAYYGPDLQSAPNSPPPVRRNQVRHLMPYRVRWLSALCYQLAYYGLMSLICWYFGHDLVDPLDGNPESGWVSVACKRCGYYSGGYWS